MKTTAAITAVAGYVPDYVLSNTELEKLVPTTPQPIPNYLHSQIDPALLHNGYLFDQVIILYCKLWQIRL